MNIVVDANILISAIIKPTGILPKLIILNSGKIDFVIPDYALDEIRSKKEKICKQCSITAIDFDITLEALIPYLLIFPLNDISMEMLQKAENLTSSIDRKDAIYVALSYALDALLWTGDVKLYKGLRRKGFNNVITTNELQNIFKGLE